MIKLRFSIFILILGTSGVAFAQSNLLVLQSDFGLKDGAVAAMKGVAVSVSADLKIFDLTHEIPAYDIWEAAYRLNQSVSYWPAGTVFVSIVDPGVGSARRSVVLKTKSGHYVVTPDNGTLTLIGESLGVDEVREIDEKTNRLAGSGESYTFHGRDVYAFTGARLAAGIITFQQVGEKVTGEIVKLRFQKPVFRDGEIKGTIDILDVQYGNLWTNIPQKMLEQINLKYGEKVRIRIMHKGRLIYEEVILFERTFSAVAEGQPIAYLNSLLNFSIALNKGSFAEKHKVASGPDWNVSLSRE
jgi:S-adenosylmethionine hydrolase